MTHRPSSLVLILANQIPPAGVVLFDWDILAILLLYWSESVIVGALNVFKIIAYPSDNIMTDMILETAARPVTVPWLQELIKGALRTVGVAFKLFLIPLFILHYGLFCLVHLYAVVEFFADGEISLGARFSLAELWQGSFWISVVAILLSHLYSFFKNYIGKGEYRMATVNLLMFRPFGRLFAMQLAILLGAGLVSEFGSPLPMLLILTVAKTALDLRMHVRERGVLATP